MTFKTITVKKRGGGTRRQKVKVLASGKYKFVKNSSTSSRKSTKRKSSSKRRSVKRVIKKTVKVTHMARRRRSTRRSSKSSGLVGSLKRFAKPAAIGLGIPAVIALGGSAIGNPGLGNNKLVSAGAAFAIGGPIAGLSALLLSPGGLSLGGSGDSSGEGLA